MHSNYQHLLHAWPHIRISCTLLIAPLLYKYVLVVSGGYTQSLPQPEILLSSAVVLTYHTELLFRLSEITFVSARHWTLQNLLRQVKSHVTHTFWQYYFLERLPSLQGMFVCVYILLLDYMYKALTLKQMNKMQIFAFSNIAQKLFHRCNNEFVFLIWLFSLRYLILWRERISV